MNTLLIIGTSDGLVIARREEHTWQALEYGLTSHQITSTSVQGGVILAGTKEGVFRSDDLGQSWRTASKGLSDPHIRWLAHHPDGSGRVLAGTEPAAIYLSHDNGGNWAERPEVAALRDEMGWYLPYSPEAGCVRGFAFHGKRVYAAVEQGGLLRSDDGGEHWQLARGSTGAPRTPPAGYIHPDVHSVTVHPLSPDLVYAPTGGGLYCSKNGGQSWTLLYPCYCRAVWSDPADNEHLVFGPADSVDRNGRIEETRDGGHTWQRASQGLDVPWARHMVERFLRVDYELLAVLSNGEVQSTRLETLRWQHILPDAGRVHALSVMRA